MSSLGREERKKGERGKKSYSSQIAHTSGRHTRGQTGETPTTTPP